MKKKIIILIIVFLSFNMGTIFFYGKYNSNEKTMLTKNEIFDIIDNIDATKFVESLRKIFKL